MLDHLAALIVDESKWLTASMTCALAAALSLALRHRRSGIPARRLVLGAMSLFFAVTIGTMALGHLLAVSTKLALGTLEGSLLVFYGIGVALAVPSCWLVVQTPRILASERANGRTGLLNAWLAATLLVMGVHNLPLAAPGLLNIAYLIHSRRVVGLAILGLAVVLNVGLFVGSLVFLASGQSFEQFSGSR